MQIPRSSFTTYIGFSPQRVARDKQLTAAKVDHCKGEHPAETIHEPAATPFLEPVHQNLGVRVMSPELMTTARQKLAQFSVIVDFAVEDDPNVLSCSSSAAAQIC